MLSNSKKAFLSTLLSSIIFFSGCSDNGDDSGSGAERSTATEVTAVDGYIKNARVTDSLSAVARYTADGKYTFSSSPSYPLRVTGGVIEDSDVPFDINMSVYANGTLVISPITTFLGNDSALLDKFTNLGLAQTTLQEFSVDYVDTNSSDLAKLSQIFYVILRDENLTATFKESLLNATPTSMDEIFTLAEADINASRTIGREEKIISKNILAQMKDFNSSVSIMETMLKTAKEKLAFVNEYGNPFTTVWETNSSDSNITIPTNSNYLYNYIIDWGDGNISSDVTNTQSHVYTTDGNHTIKIYGEFPAIRFMDDTNNMSSDDNGSLKSILSWGDINWKSMNKAFINCGNMELNTSDNPNLSNVSDLSLMFFGASSFNQDISSWDTSNVIDMYGMFASASIFNQDISSWDTSNVRYISFMFQNTLAFNQDIGSWDTSNVLDMSWTFSNALEFNQDIGRWDTSNVTSFNGMFYGATNFNQNIGSWNTSNIIDMSAMFYSAPNFNQAIGSWDTSNAEDLSFIFYRASSFNQDINSWDTSNVTDMSAMFYFASDFNQSLDLWNTFLVEDFSFMFCRASSFNQDISSWDTSYVTNMAHMFHSTSAFNQDISGWDTSIVTNMTWMFKDASDFTDQNLSSWDVANITNHDEFMTGSGSGNTEPTWP